MEYDLLIEEDDLFDLYETLARATEAAASGDPNTVASKASDAKDKVVEIREDAEEITPDEINQQENT